MNSSWTWRDFILVVVLVTALTLVQWLCVKVVSSPPGTMVLLRVFLIAWMWVVNSWILIVFGRYMQRRILSRGLPEPEPPSKEHISTQL